MKYCPYGPLVEDYPLLPPTRKDATEHTEYLQGCLDTGILGNGEPLDEGRRKWFEETVADHDSDSYPESIPKVLKELACSVFGHLCPVFFVSEHFTETDEQRRTGRSIPFPVRLRVARRDNYTCQSCGTHLKDDELEYDHIIPLSKGGSSEEHNLRLTCTECNRKKSNRYSP